MVRLAMSTAESPSRFPDVAPRGAVDWVLLGGIGALALALCLPALWFLSFVWIWRFTEFYGHVFLLPLVALYVLYENRHEVQAVLRELRPPPLGPLVVFAAAVYEVATVVGDAGFLAGQGVPIVLAAAAYAVGGTRLLRPFTLPLVFLVLMVPPPAPVIYALTARLKLFVTDVAVSLLHTGGAPVLAEGNRISVPGHTLFVADACTGLTSIVTLIPLAAVVAYFLSHGVWRRLAVLGSVVPLAMAGNVLRVTVTVLLVSRIGVETAQGLLHQGFGLATYAAGTLALVGVARLLR